LLGFKGRDSPAVASWGDRNPMPPLCGWAYHLSTAKVAVTSRWNSRCRQESDDDLTGRRLLEGEATSIAADQFLLLSAYQETMLSR